MGKLRQGCQQGRSCLRILWPCDGRPFSRRQENGRPRLDNNQAVRKTLLERGIRPETLPAAEDVKTLRAIVNDEDVANDLLKPSDKPASMSNVLFCANQIFTSRAPSFGSKRLFIITDNDNPHSTDKTLRSQAAVRAKDLYDLGVVIELFPISHPDHKFDRTKFYDVS